MTAPTGNYDGPKRELWRPQKDMMAASKGNYGCTERKLGQSRQEIITILNRKKNGGGGGPGESSTVKLDTNFCALTYFGELDREAGDPIFNWKNHCALSS